MHWSYTPSNEYGLEWKGLTSPSRRHEAVPHQLADVGFDGNGSNSAVSSTITVSGSTSLTRTGIQTSAFSQAVSSPPTTAGTRNYATLGRQQFQRPCSMESSVSSPALLGGESRRATMTLGAERQTLHTLGANLREIEESGIQGQYISRPEAVVEEKRWDAERKQVYTFRISSHKFRPAFLPRTSEGEQAIPRKVISLKTLAIARKDITPTISAEVDRTQKLRLIATWEDAFRKLRREIARTQHDIAAYEGQRNRANQGTPTQPLVGPRNGTSGLAHEAASKRSRLATTPQETRSRLPTRGELSRRISHAENVGQRLGLTIKRSTARLQQDSSKIVLRPAGKSAEEPANPVRELERLVTQFVRANSRLSSEIMQTRRSSGVSGKRRGIVQRPSPRARFRRLQTTFRVVFARSVFASARFPMGSESRPSM